MQKIKEFDGIRGVAIIAIVTCHICYGIDSMSPLGQYLGGTFNIVFFALSSILIGINIQATQYSVHDNLCKSSFFKKRLKRLVPDLWIFLTIYLLIAFFFNINCTVPQIIANYLMLGWFAKMPYCGHLWFVTMILFCYIFFTISLNIKNKLLLLINLSITCIIGQIIFSLIHFPAYMFLILFISGIFMLYSSDILDLISKLKTWTTFIVTSSINIIYYFLISHNFLIIGNLDYYYMAVISGVCMIILLYKLFQQTKVSKFLSWVSLFSYQIYLVHHPLCNTNWMSTIIGNQFLAIISIYLMSFFCASML